MSAPGDRSLLPEPLPFHRECVAILKETEPELWRWASSWVVDRESMEGVRTELLKNTYRLDADAHPELAGRLSRIAARMGIEARVTVYQAQGGGGMNASICCLPGEAHLVFSGPVLSSLTGVELDAVLGHELAHLRLWTLAGGEYQVAERLLSWAVADPRCDASHVQTARRMRLYTEIFADRGGVAACGDLETTVAALVKLSTGLTEVSGVNYLRQADEIFSREKAVAEGMSHPEPFIRARALRMWVEGDGAVDRWLAGVIEGGGGLDDLDLAGRLRVAGLTRRFLCELLRPEWFRTEAVMAHARAFFGDFDVGAGGGEILGEIRGLGESMREYFCYLLLDFVAVDPALNELSLGRALEWSVTIGMGEPFEKLAVRELGLTKRRLAKVKKDVGEKSGRSGRGQ